MRTPLKLSAYGGALALAFGGSLVLGNTIGSPVSAVEAPHAGMHSAGGTEADAASPAAAQPAVKQPGGIMTSDRGYTLRLGSGILPAGAGQPLEFQILEANGTPVTSYQVSHDKDMHLIAVRRDASGFQHVHPELAADGTWTVPLDLSAGVWRIFADFVPAQGQTAGENTILGADLSVPGDYQPAPLPAPSTTAVVDGYTVTLDGGFQPGKESELTLSVSRDGAPVTDLQPYLGAFGHLVALRDGDLAYLHVHPAGTPGDGTTQPGPDVTFYATAPSAGAYRLFLDFKHGDVVRTAEFTVEAGAADGAAVSTPAESAAPEEVGSTPHEADNHSH